MRCLTKRFTELPGKVGGGLVGSTRNRCDTQRFGVAHVNEVFGSEEASCDG